MQSMHALLDRLFLINKYLGRVSHKKELRFTNGELCGGSSENYILRNSFSHLMNEASYIYW